MSNQKEFTFIIIKPDAVASKYTENILDDFEAMGLSVSNVVFTTPSLERSQEHYEEHKGKEFYNELCEFLSSGPVVTAILSGPLAVSRVRQALGSVAIPEKNILASGLRGKYGTSIKLNAIHASDSSESAIREHGLWWYES